MIDGRGVGTDDNGVGLHCSNGQGCTRHIDSLDNRRNKTCRTGVVGPYSDEGELLAVD